MNLIETLKNEIGSSAIDQISEKIGISTQQANAAIDAGIPTTLAGILKNTDSLTGSGFLGNMLSSTHTDSISNENADQDSLLSKGRSLLDSLFGVNSSTVTNSLANHIGVSEDKSTGLMALILPMITGAISKVISQNGWSISDFVSKIWNSKSEISNALPANLASSLGVAGIDSSNIEAPVVEQPRVIVPPVSTPKIEVPRITEPAVERPKQVFQEEKKSSSFLSWLIPLLLVIGALWYFFGRKTENKMTVVGDSTEHYLDTTVSVAKGTLNDMGDYIADFGDTITKTLPDGKEIKIGSNSVENHLVNFIEDKDRVVDKDTWFTFDRLFFETGKSTLKPESQVQLENMAAILKAFPNVKLKLGGYTDNTGDADINKTISSDRAKAAIQALVGLGINAGRLEAEGYGAEHPVASNETVEGKAQNRRIDVRVTNK